VSKRSGSRYSSGTSRSWLKPKRPGVYAGVMLGITTKVISLRDGRRTERRFDTVILAQREPYRRLDPM
jgi:hypothetical protein